MMKWILLIWQVFSLKSGFSQAKSAADYVEEGLAKARDYFVFTIGCTIATLFLLIAVVVFIIAAGLQIENSGGLSFTGLMISAALFLAISVFSYFISFLILVIKKQKAMERIRQQERERNTGSNVMPILEEILKQVLAKISTPSGQPGPPPPANEPEKTASEK